jgi:hypothetical protein
MSYLNKKIPLEEVIKLLLQTQQENILFFLEKTKTNPRWYATNSFSYRYKGNIVYRLNFSDKGYWRIVLTLAKPNYLDETLNRMSAELQKFYFHHLRTCKHCNPSHGNGKRFIILGNEYFGCAEPEVEIINPTIADIEILCKYIDIRKENIKQLKNM